MKTLIAALLMLPTLTLSAEPPTSQAAIDAKTAYEADIKAAQEKYKQALAKALQEAIASGDKDALARIADEIRSVGEPDPLEKAKQIIMEKTYIVPNGSERRFLPNGKIWNKEAGRQSTSLWGVWQILDPKTIVFRVTSGSGNYFVWEFDEEFNEYRSVRMLLDEERHGIKTGKALITPSE